MKKLVLLLYNVSIEDDVKALLEREKALYFTQWPRLLGKGPSTGARFDNNVWPGANGALFTVVSQETATRILAAVEEMRAGLAKREGLEALVLPVEATTTGM